MPHSAQASDLRCPTVPHMPHTDERSCRGRTKNQKPKLRPALAAPDCADRGASRSAEEQGKPHKRYAHMRML